VSDERFFVDTEEGVELVMTLGVIGVLSGCVESMRSLPWELSRPAASDAKPIGNTAYAT
jgi:hypothetical protein